MRYLAFESIPVKTQGLPPFLTPREKKIWKDLKTPKRSQEWLAGRLAAKRAVAQALETMDQHPSLREIEILNDKSGKPIWRLMTPSPYDPITPSLAISISHSHELAGSVASLASDSIGLDIEKIETRHPAWLEEAFSPQERAQISSPDQATRLWTRKEAVLKFLGIGLNIDLWAVPYLADMSIESWKKDAYWITLCYGN